MKKSLRDRTAIVGVGNTPFGALYRNLDPERSPYDLGADAFVEALADAGLSKSDIDGVLVCRIPDYGRMCEVMGIRYPRFVNVMQAGGRMASVTVQYAASVDFGSGTWRPVSGYVTSTSGGYDVRVVEARTALVDRTCVENPAGPGC